SLPRPFPTRRSSDLILIAWSSSAAVGATRDVMAANLDLCFSATFGRHVLFGIPYLERVAERQFWRRPSDRPARSHLGSVGRRSRSEEHTSELQSRGH